MDGTKGCALVIDAGCKYGGMGGRLNHLMSNVAEKTLRELGYEVLRTTVDAGYVVADEVDKILRADVVIVQTPGWWMGPPWKFKKYEDEVLVDGRLSDGDGRTRTAPDDNYGHGGKCQGKRYLLASTWNAPRAAFEREGDFFEGRGVDGVLFPVHKTFQFLGMAPLPSFMSNDVIKNPHIDRNVVDWIRHLRAVLG